MFCASTVSREGVTRKRDDEIDGFVFFCVEEMSNDQSIIMLR